jgi:hypothetical protein
VIPGPWEFALLAAAAWRVYRLLAEDTILDRPRAFILGVPGWKPIAHEPPPDGYREHLATFLTCPFCAGFWVSLAAWGLWSWQPHWTLAACAPFAVNAAVALVATRLDG